MKKILLFVCCLALISIINCSDDKKDKPTGSTATALGNTLNIAGTITHTFDTNTSTWAANFVHAGGINYNLKDDSSGINDGAIIATDISDDAVLGLSTGIPGAGDMVTPADWGFNSTSTTVKIYSVKIDDTSLAQATYYEGNFDITTNNVVQYYIYMYVTEANTLSGSTTGGGETHIINNVTLSAGWNQLICQTADGTTFNYYGGAITGAKWTKMIE